MQARLSTKSGASKAKLQPSTKANVRGMTVLSGASLVERDKLLEDMIKELRRENDSLQQAVKQLEDKPEEKVEVVKVDDVFEKLDDLGEERKKMEREMQAIENRIRHMQAENDEAEKEIAEYDVKTRKVLEARQKKIEWERQRQEELEKAKEANTKRRIELIEAAKLRDQVISQRRDVFSKQSKKLMDDIEADRDVREKLKARVVEYEQILAEHRRLKALKDTKANKQDHAFEERQRKKDQKMQLEQRVRDEANRLTEMDRRLERLKLLEQQMMEDKQRTMTQKGVLKSQFHDILNRKLDEKEIKDILAREKANKNVIHRSGSMTKMLEVVEEKKSMKSPMQKSRIVGLNSSITSNQDTGRQSINKSAYSGVRSKIDTGRSVEKKLGKPTTVKASGKPAMPTPASPSPLRDKNGLKTGHSTPNITPQSTPGAGPRKSIKEGTATPTQVKSSRFHTGSTATKKAPPADGKASGMPVAAKPAAVKRPSTSGNTAKVETKTDKKPEETQVKVEGKRKSAKEVKEIQERVEKIIDNQDSSPAPLNDTDKSPVKPIDEAKTSQWEEAESPKKNGGEGVAEVPAKLTIEKPADVPKVEQEKPQEIKVQPAEAKKAEPQPEEKEKPVEEAEIPVPLPETEVIQKEKVSETVKERIVEPTPEVPAEIHAPVEETKVDDPVELAKDEEAQPEESKKS